MDGERIRVDYVVVVVDFFALWWSEMCWFFVSFFGVSDQLSSEWVVSNLFSGGFSMR